MTIHKMLEEYQRAHTALRASLQAVFRDAGLDLVSAQAGEDGVEWTLVVRPSGQVRSVDLPRAEPTQSERDLRELEAVLAEQLQVRAPETVHVELALPEAPIPAPPMESRGAHPSDPTASLKPVESLPGESFSDKLEKENHLETLAYTSGDGGIGVAAMTAPEQVRVLGPTLVGDAFLDMRHRGADESDEFAVAEVVKAYGIYRDEAERLVGRCDPAPFLRALSEWAPADFPAGEQFLQRVG